MDEIVTYALVGTAQLGQINRSTDTPVDSLLAKLPENASERLLLLHAGAWAIYLRAGKLAESIPAEVPELAPEETLPACTHSVSLLLHRLFLEDHGDLLPEALELLHKTGYRLPHELLPMALSLSGHDVRSTLFPVLGERGYWLSRFNSDWKWVQQFESVPGNSLPPNAETLWEEGTTSQRAEILRRLRVFDTVMARTWLEATWKQENAETRSAFLQTLEVGLGSEDEAFLEHALDDRAANVRSQARHLLARIPSSDFANRVKTLADSFLTFTQGKLKLTSPTSYHTSWQRDGISEKPQGGLGECAWWLIQILAQVPLSHWEKHASMPPVELIATADDDAFGNSIVEGWTRSAIVFNTSTWSGPLWDWWHTQQKKGKLGGTTTSDMRDELIRLLSSEEAEAKVMHILRDDRVSEDGDWGEMLDGLPAPWSVAFGNSYLKLLRRHLKVLEESNIKNNAHFSADTWCRSLARAAIGLPVSCFREALESYSLPELATSWQVEHWCQQLHRFTETLSLRQRLYEEIK